MSACCIVPDIIIQEELGPIIFQELKKDMYIQHALDILEKVEKKEDVFLFSE